MFNREQAIAFWAAKMNIETAASFDYSMRFCQEFANALARLQSKPLTGKELENARDRADAEEAMAEFELKGGVPIGQIEADIAIDTAQRFADQFRSGAAGANMDCDAAQILAASVDHLIANQKLAEPKGLRIKDWIGRTLNEVRSDLGKGPISPLTKDILEIVEGIEKFRQEAKEALGWTNPAPDASAPRAANEVFVDSAGGVGKNNPTKKAERMPASFPQAGYVMMPEIPTEEHIEELTNIIRRSAWSRDNVISQYKRFLDIAGEAREDPRWQKIREIFGLNGWVDGQWHGIPNPEQIITHIDYIAKDRARLIFENADLKSKVKALQLPHQVTAIGDFNPCIMINEDLGTTVIHFEDVAYVAEPIFDGIHHWMDKHVSIKGGRIVGATIWQTKPKPQDRVVIFECPTCGGKGGDEDTTYNRSGVWVDCGVCGGSGERAIVKKLPKPRPVGKDD